MLQPTALFLDEYIDSLITAKNHDIFDKRLTDLANYPEFKKNPCHMYFYYIRFGTDGYPIIRQYDREFAEPGLSYDDVPHVINSMADNARSDGHNPDPTHPLDFANMQWNRLSYIVFVIDSDCWGLWKRPSKPNSAVVVNPNKIGYMKGTDNHTFFDASDVDVKIMNTNGNVDTRSGIFFVNHMKKDEIGTMLGSTSKESEYFAFELYCDVYGDGGTLPTVFVIDPGGTNMGPPAPPPAYLYKS